MRQSAFEGSIHGNVATPSLFSTRSYASCQFGRYSNSTRRPACAAAFEMSCGAGPNPGASRITYGSHSWMYTRMVRACATALVEAAKRGGTSLVLVGHVTKGGDLAGPRLLEHLVDTVLAFEGDRYHELRSLRAVKNRYGSTQEIGLFTMGGAGLEEVADPGGLFIAGREGSVPGSCVVPALEGNRCLLVEIQALVNPTELPQPQRRVSGCDPNRVAMILAVLSRRLRLPLGGCDVFVNVTAGARITEPAADLGVALAVASAWRDSAVPLDLVALGEIGLGGELRPASRYDLRAAEARRLGFKRLLGPGPGEGRGRLKATTLAEAIDAALGED